MPASGRDFALAAAWIASAGMLISRDYRFPSSISSFFAASLETQALTAVLALVGFFLFFKLVVLSILRLFYETNPFDTTWQLLTTFSSQEKRRNVNVGQVIDEYNGLHDADVKEREAGYKKLVDYYYELATQFYEWGWGQSFHFANRMKDESFYESIRKHEYYLAGRLNVKKGSKIVDCGCGIGGPMRNIARFTESDVVGVTINEYQVQRGNTINKQMGVYGQCKSIQGDFMHLPFPEETFDAAYAIEATCHAPSRHDVYTEIMRVIKPGGMFVSYEWCLTDRYDAKNPDHRRVKKMIEEGDGLPDVLSCREVAQAIKDVGFELVEDRDMTQDRHIHQKWYLPLTANWNILSQRFQFNPIGIRVTRVMLRLMELVGLAPKGTAKVQAMLQQGALGLAEGGALDIFTPMYLIVARKPLNATASNNNKKK